MDAFENFEVYYNVIYISILEEKSTILYLIDVVLFHVNF